MKKRRPCAGVFLCPSHRRTPVPTAPVTGQAASSHRYAHPCASTCDAACARQPTAPPWIPVFTGMTVRTIRASGTRCRFGGRYQKNAGTGPASSRRLTKQLTSCRQPSNTSRRPACAGCSRRLPKARRPCRRLRSASARARPRRSSRRATWTSAWRPCWTSSPGR